MIIFFIFRIFQEIYVIVEGGLVVEVKSIVESIISLSEKGGHRNFEGLKFDKNKNEQINKYLPGFLDQLLTHEFRFGRVGIVLNIVAIQAYRYRYAHVQIGHEYNIQTYLNIGTIKSS